MHVLKICPSSAFHHCLKSLKHFTYFLESLFRLKKQNKQAVWVKQWKEGEKRETVSLFAFPLRHVSTQTYTWLCFTRVYARSRANSFCFSDLTAVSDV